MFKKVFIFFVLSLGIYSAGFAQSDIVDDLAKDFKESDYRELAKKFASSVEIILMDEQDVYSKVQGEQIIKDFFSKHPSGKINIVHRINNSPNYRFGVLNMQSGRQSFRISITLKKISNSFLITELRIESGKE